MSNIVRVGLIQASNVKGPECTDQAIKKAIRPSIVEVTKAPAPARTSKEYLEEYLRELEFKMDLANRNLQFDEAMRLKAQIAKLKKAAN